MTISNQTSQIVIHSLTQQQHLGFEKIVWMQTFVPTPKENYCEETITSSKSGVHQDHYSNKTIPNLDNFNIYNVTNLR